MLGPLLLEIDSIADRPAIVTASRTVSWAELSRTTLAAVDRYRDLGRCRVGIRLSAQPESVAALAALDRLGADVTLLDEALSDERVRDLAGRYHLAAVIDPTDEADPIVVGEPPLPSGHGFVTILTSGTTGEPKAARHTWASLARPVRRRPDLDGSRWLLTYRPQLYAGLQVMLQCLINRGVLVMSTASSSPDAVIELMVSERIEYASATPSYWRRLILFGNTTALSSVPLRQITLGGEVVDQVLLDELRRLYPEARLVHIYATTELGRCFSVTDGQAGFPTRFLERVSDDGVALRVADGELLVRSANAMHSIDGVNSGTEAGDGWTRTQDLVVIVGDRVLFVGRSSDIINVGGNKVHPIEVERVIRSLAGVADVRVYARASSIAGQIVACDLVITKGADATDVRRRVVTACGAGLVPHQRPRVVRTVERIELADSGKVVRRSP